MPSGAFTCVLTAWTIATRPRGSVPPFVSQSTSQWAPAASADWRVASAYSRFRRKPSKKCSASNITSSIRGRSKAIVSAIIFKFSSSVVESAWVTWKSHDLPTIVATGAPVATIVGKSWDFHVTHALSTTLDENLKMIADTIALLRPRMEEVMFDAEHFFDGFRRNREYALATLQSAEAAGAHWLVLCDTNGGTLPPDLVAVLQVVTKHVKTPLGIHVHNDAECAVANSLAAVA